MISSKEQSNNVELGFHYDNNRFDYHIHVYHNWFDDYIYAQTLDRYEDFRLVKYTQDKARFMELRQKLLTKFLLHTK